MGDEADADWQEGLVEWGYEDAMAAFRAAQYRYRDPRKLPKRRAQSDDASRKREG